MFGVFYFLTLHRRNPLNGLVVSETALCSLLGQAPGDRPSLVALMHEGATFKLQRDAAQLGHAKTRWTHNF